MKKIYLTFLTAFLLISINTFSQDWELVWADEFTNGISEDWVFEIGDGCPNLCGWGNNELQYYRRENATVENGMLVITAKKENFGTRQYTSTRMKTQGNASFTYGRIEARMKLPAFQGSWPAFWMLGESITSVGWPACGEIDIMEQINTENKTHGTIHWHNGSDYASYGGPTSFDVNVTDFNVYAIEWDKDNIKWFVNGTHFWTASIANNINSTDEFHQPHFLLLNLAIGGNWPGTTIDNTAFPAKMVVDYVRVYQKEGDDNGTTPEPMEPLQIEAESHGWSNGISDHPTTDEGGGQHIRFNAAGNWAAYQPVNITQTGEYLVEFRVAAESAGGKLRFEAASGTMLLATLDIPSTGSNQTWTTISQTITLNAGSYSFGLNSPVAGFNLNWFRISPVVANNIPNQISDKTFRIYPNPINGSDFRIDAKDIDLSNARLLMTSLDGRVIYQRQLSVNNERISLPNHIAKGVYIISVELQNGILSEKVVVN